jgi:NADP-dependent 3-hydroxy acid dehydrogenase YdfG
MVDLKGKCAVVTGASRGIGAAAAHALAREGVDVVLAARSADDLNAVADALTGLGVKALPVPTDLADEASVLNLKQAALAEFGQVDILVNNAGVAKYAPLLEHTVADYDWMMDTNMRSTFLCVRHFLPEMVERESGSIVVVSSQAGLFGFGGEAVYCATKFAQVGFCQALDAEVRERGVKVSVIAPGGVNTHLAFGTGREPGAPYLEEMLEADSVADAIVFAASQPPESRVLLIGMRPMSEPPF